MKILAYLRGVPESLDVETQVKTIAKWASENGHELTWAQEDTPFFGANSKLKTRKGLQNALTNLRNGVAEAMVVARLDVLTRSITQLIMLEGTGISHGFELISLDGVINTFENPYQRRFLHELGQWQGELIGTACIASINASKFKSGATAPGAIKRILIETEKGHSARRVAEILNNDGVTTRTGYKWTHPNVRRILNSWKLDEHMPDGIRKKSRRSETPAILKYLEHQLETTTEILDRFGHKIVPEERSRAINALINDNDAPYKAARDKAQNRSKRAKTTAIERTKKLDEIDFLRAVEAKLKKLENEALEEIEPNFPAS